MIRSMPDAPSLSDMIARMSPETRDVWERARALLQLGNTNVSSLIVRSMGRAEEVARPERPIAPSGAFQERSCGLAQYPQLSWD